MWGGGGVAMSLGIFFGNGTSSKPHTKKGSMVASMFTAKARVRRPSRSSSAKRRRAQAKEYAVGAFSDMTDLDDLEIQVTLLRTGYGPVVYNVPFGTPLRQLPGYDSGQSHYLVLNHKMVILLLGSQRLIDADLTIRQVNPRKSMI